MMKSIGNFVISVSYFVERLMGWPLGWASAIAQPGSNAAEMELWQLRLRALLSSLFDAQDYFKGGGLI